MMDTQTQQPPAANSGDAKNTSTPKRIKALVAWWKSIAKLVAITIVVIFLATIIWLCGALATHHGIFNSKVSFGELEQLENTFSPVNAFFAGLSGIGIIVTLFLQQTQISGAKKDAEENNGRLEKQLTITQEQFKLERFESIFFNLLSIHNENSREIRNSNFSFISLVNDLGSAKKGHNSLYQQIKSLDDAINFIPLSKKEAAKFEFDEYFNTTDYTICIFARIYKQHKNSIMHYYRHLYHLIKYTNKTFDDAPEKRRLYMRIIRAQFTAAEHVALFYNALYYADPEDRNEAQAAGQPAPEGQQESTTTPASKFKRLIERNELLHEMDKSMLIYPEIHEHFYDKKAYGDD
ncbi:putative phage abortive infection protein [Nitratidesulfovibrio vulgaris]|nr:putative phage abortive infection protein [Nitratidesulfovibrio vulgaris]